jgi:L-fuconolactonase
VSGLVTEAKLGAWTREDFHPYLDVVFGCFGEDRSMFGSDWPVCLLSGSYAKVFGIADHYLTAFSQTARTKIFGSNAAKFYRTPMDKAAPRL